MKASKWFSKAMTLGFVFFMALLLVNPENSLEFIAMIPFGAFVAYLLTENYNEEYHLPKGQQSDNTILLGDMYLLNQIVDIGLQATAILLGKTCFGSNTRQHILLARTHQRNLTTTILAFEASVSGQSRFSCSWVL